MPRYESYKDSGTEWLGDIPRHWIVEKGKWIFKKESRPIQSDDEVITCFRDGQVTLRKNRKTDGFTNALQEIGYQRVCKGDLVIHAMDAFAGAIGVSDSYGKSSPVYSVCTPLKSNSVDPAYYAYLLRDLALSGVIVSLAKGIRERSTDFRFNDFGGLHLSIPPLEEQQEIVAFLNKKTAQIDQAIAIKQRQIALLKERKQIIIQNAVTKGINPDAPMKASGVDWIGDIPEYWEVKRIKYVTSKIGSGITPTGGGATYVDDGIPLLRSQNIHFGSIDFADAAKISQRIHRTMRNSQVQRGDVLLNITGGSIGRCHYVETDAALNVNQHVCIVRPNIQIDTIFLNAVLASDIGQSQVWLYQQSGGREGLNFQAINNFYLALPPKFEQVKIGNYLKEMSIRFSSAIDLYQTQIHKLQEYKATLINSAVTGKIKIS